MKTEKTAAETTETKTAAPAPEAPKAEAPAAESPKAEKKSKKKTKAAKPEKKSGKKKKAAKVVEASGPSKKSKEKREGKAKASPEAGGLRAAFRSMLAAAAEKKGGKVGTRASLFEKLLAAFPGDKAKANIASYVAYAKGGTMTGCHILLEDEEGNLKTGKLVPSKRAAE